MSYLSVYLAYVHHHETNFGSTTTRYYARFFFKSAFLKYLKLRTLLEVKLLVRVLILLS